ncbi:MAG TPA: hypothetical protein VGL89_09890 [Candidatus Koribacter sp.]|jgi:hypothetical protein
MADRHNRNPHEVGPDSAGQSGDLQQLPRRPDANDESVEELIEEGNAFEAEVISGSERAADDADAPVQTHEVPEDDVPAEYRDDQNRDVA